MDRRIWLLAGAQFAAATGAYAFTGMLAPMAADLGVSLATAGQLATAYALTYALCGAPAAALTARMDRRSLLLIGLVLVGLLNLATAAAPDVGVMLALRIATGAAITLVLPGVAASMIVPPEQRARAMANVLAGMTFAFSLGIPLGTAIGGWFGWRACFVFGGAIALVAAVAVRAGLPPLPSTDRGGAGSAGRVMRRDILLVLAASLLSFAGLFCIAAYLGPIVTAITGITGAGIGAIQAFVGIGSIAGILIGGRAAMREGAAVPTALMLLLAAALLGYSSLLAFAPALWHAAPLAACVFAGSAALFALAPIMQTRLITLAPEDRAVALALSGAVALGGQGLGAAYGGVVIAAAGLAWTGVAGAMLAGLGAVLAWRAFSRG
ncbi:MFS transporter [Roseomonas sp. AR75]|uniref:MFS transporter n=1 Tax=Roseomonas sp. AR75 TaxID=2562311 RepID=UPI0010C03F1C|nr:MFS transporter [Roseomonas sp. AR75]